MNFDQASTLRQIVNNNGRAAPSQNIRVMSVTSGKGGVGKTNIAINLAYALSNLGKKVLLFDADLGLANVDVLLNISPRYTIEHVLSGEKDINDIILEGPNHIKILPSSSGISDLAELNRDEQMYLFKKLGQIEHTLDYLLIDTGAGIASNVLRFNATANDILLVATPEPTSMTDAYSLMKVLATKYNVRKFHLVANSVQSQAEARMVYERLQKVTHDFLNVQLHYAGFVIRDPTLIKAVRMQKPLLEIFPNAPASKCLMALAKQIENNYDRGIAGVPLEQENSGKFWDRFLQWKRNK
ncbi:MAG: MinD/ParA family protein [SAR324 cluster bacterium]|nr:MinD/ParA family protein [SAR324 cluster bacterium]